MNRIKCSMFSALSILAMSAITIAQAPPATPQAPPVIPAAPSGQPATQAPLTVSGKIDISYKTRTQLDDAGSPQKGVKDVYAINATVADTLLFQGKIEHLPTIFSKTLGRETQASTLSYDLDLSLRNPANPAQTKAVGKLVGTTPIDKKGVYRYNDGNLRIAVDSSGAAAGFESRFQGVIEGRSPKNESSLARAKKQAMSVTKNIQGKKVKIEVKDYDVMKFNDFVMASGPVKAYPESRVNGDMIYDYERSAWYFNGISISYLGADGKAITDKLSGHIKWVESPQRSTNGEGEYQFDVRVNEPELSTSEAAAFQPASSEEDFFRADTTIPSLTGTWKYKDELRSSVPASSVVTINMVGNKLTKPQVVVLWKLIGLVDIVPMNAE